MRLGSGDVCTVLLSTLVPLNLVLKWLKALLFVSFDQMQWGKRLKSVRWQIQLNFFEKDHFSAEGGSEHQHSDGRGRLFSVNFKASLVCKDEFQTTQ